MQSGGHFHRSLTCAAPPSCRSGVGDSFPAPRCRQGPHSGAMHCHPRARRPPGRSTRPPDGTVRLALPAAEADSAPSTDVRFPSLWIFPIVFLADWHACRLLDARVCLPAAQPPEARQVGVAGDLAGWWRRPRVQHPLLKRCGWWMQQELETRARDVVCRRSGAPWAHGRFAAAQQPRGAVPPITGKRLHKTSSSFLAVSAIASTLHVLSLRLLPPFCATKLSADPLLSCAR